MRLLLFLVFLCNLAFANAQQRCTTHNCMCAVVHDSTPTSRRIIQVKFAEDSSTISQKYHHALTSYQDEARVYGMTDGCGSRAHNRELALQRAKAVGKLLRKFRISTAPEISKRHDPQARTVLVVPKNNKYLNYLATHPADIYLLDASGSMYGKWDAIKTFPFPRQSKVYVAKDNNCQNGQLLRSIEAYGGTEVILPYYILIKDAPHGSRITVITDGRHHTNPLPSEQALLERIVKERRLKVSHLNPPGSW